MSQLHVCTVRSLVQSSRCCCFCLNRQVARAAAAEGGGRCGATEARQAQAPDQLPVPRRQAEGKPGSCPDVGLLIRCSMRLPPSDIDVDLDVGTCQLGLRWMRSRTQSLLPCAGTGDAERPGQLDQNKAGDAGKVWLVMRCEARPLGARWVVISACSHAGFSAEQTVCVQKRHCHVHAALLQVAALDLGSRRSIAKSPVQEWVHPSMLGA